MVPFENSTYGPVVDTLDLLAQAPSRYPALHVIAESYIAVHHALVGRPSPADSSNSSSSDDPSLSHTSSSSTGISPRATFVKLASAHSSGTATPTLANPNPQQPRAKPRTSLAHIQRIYSHPQAFGQTGLFLNTYLKHAERHETASTAAAAARIAALPPGLCNEAAIASTAAAKLRGLDVLAAEIEDQIGNQTRFLTVTHLPRAAVEANYQQRQQNVPQTLKTLISFSLHPHAPAGALAQALAAFTEHGLNLTSIHARPSGRRAWDYVFFVECEHAEQSAEAVEWSKGDDMSKAAMGSFGTTQQNSHHGARAGSDVIDLATSALKDRVESWCCHGRYKSRAHEQV